MNSKRILRKMKIKNIIKVAYEDKENFCKKVSDMLVNEYFFTDSEFMYNKLKNVDMYLAEIPKEYSKAIYFYEDAKLYIDVEIGLEDINDDILHECLHIIQEQKNKNGKTARIGNCIFEEFKARGMALNEVSVQYIISKLGNLKIEETSAYGIRAQTYSENKYPLICNLLLQLLLITDEQKLIKSTIYATDDFIDDCIKKIGEYNYYDVRDIMDDLLYASEEVAKYKNKIKSGKNIEEDRKIKKLKQKILNKYIQAQGIIFTNYFDRLIAKMQTLDDIDYYNEKLNNYFNYLGFVEKDEQKVNEYFTGFYNQRIGKVEEKRYNITNKNKGLTVLSNNKIIRLLKRIIDFCH